MGLDFDEYARYIAMLIQSIADLHSADCVHRDLKTNNYLVYKHGEEICIVLADFDDILKVSPEGEAPDNTNIAGIYGPPEYPLPYSKEKQPAKPDETKKSQPVSLKSVDVYQLGMTITDSLDLIMPTDTPIPQPRLDRIKQSLNEKVKFVEEGFHGRIHKKLLCLADYIEQNPIKELQQLFDFIISLLHKDATKRFNIYQAMQHPFFGNSPETSLNFFKNLKEEFAEHFQFTIDGIKIINPEIGNAFLLLDPTIKAIYEPAQDIERELILMDEKPGVFDMNQDSHLDEFSEEVDALEGHIDRSIIDEKEPFRELIATLRAEIEKKRKEPRHTSKTETTPDFASNLHLSWQSGALGGAKSPRSAPTANSNIVDSSCESSARIPTSPISKYNM